MLKVILISASNLNKEFFPLVNCPLKLAGKIQKPFLGGCLREVGVKNFKA